MADPRRRRRRGLLLHAARDVDPMSWFIGPYVPLVFATFIAVYGGVMVGLTWTTSDRPGFQLAGVAFCVAACLLAQLLTSLRRRFDALLGVAVTVCASAGFLFSALGYAQSLFTLDQWWAPVCFGLALCALTPYIAAWRLLLHGVIALIIVTPVAFVLVDSEQSVWGPVSAMVIIASPVAVATAAATAFSVSVVRAALPIVDNRSRHILSRAPELHPDDEEAERAALARYTSRAVPFLRGVAERGIVRPEDRAVAGELARYLRDDLVSRSGLAWLGLPADERRVVMADPDREADRLRAPQRAAIRDLVRAVLDDPATDASSVFIELRKDAAGSTAVAITLDAELPEGRRVRHLAPYYFNLRGEMSDVRLRRSGLSFRVPPAQH